MAVSWSSVCYSLIIVNPLPSHYLAIEILATEEATKGDSMGLMENLILAADPMTVAHEVRRISVSSNR